MTECSKEPQSAYLETLEAGGLGEGETLEQLFASFYEELHRRARWELRQESVAALSPTTLLHETFLNISHRKSVKFTDHRQFISYAAHAMRGLIVDHFRNRKSQRRGGLLQIISLPTELPYAAEETQSMEVEKLSDALASLARMDARLAECVNLKFFCGLSFGDIAELRNVSERTVQRDWGKARRLLSQLMKEIA